MPGIARLTSTDDTSFPTLNRSGELRHLNHTRIRSGATPVKFRAQLETTQRGEGEIRTPGPENRASA